MNYLRETGAIISDANKIISLIDGEVGSVEFPEELIWEIHKKSPGKIFELAHTHPTDMSQASGRDKQTLKTWAFALYPYPIRLSVVTYDSTKGYFSKLRYLAVLEPKELWKNSGRERKFEIIIDDIKFFRETDGWEKILIQKSYDEGGHS